MTRMKKVISVYKALFYQASVFLLLLSCMIITVGQFFKNPIDCIVNKDLVPQVNSMIPNTITQFILSGSSFAPTLFTSTSHTNTFHISINFCSGVTPTLVCSDLYILPTKNSGPSDHMVSRYDVSYKT